MPDTPTDSGDDELVIVPGVPVRLFLESQDHQHDLVRELKLVELGGRFDAATAEDPQRLAALITDVLGRYSEVRSTTREHALAALARNEETVTLAVPVRPNLVAALREWLALLERVDRLCEEGALLTLATRPELRELRRWYVEQIASRLGKPS